MGAKHLFKLTDNIRIRVVADYEYETRGSYGYDTEEETKAAEDREIAAIESGELEVYGFILESKCKECGTWNEEDSIWGCVVEPDKVKEYIVDLGWCGKALLDNATQE
jgi:hypothetical protein